MLKHLIHWARWSLSVLIKKRSVKVIHYVCNQLFLCLNKENEVKIVQIPQNVLFFLLQQQSEFESYTFNLNHPHVKI